MIDSLRSDVVDAITTPNLYKIAQQNLYYKKHFSGGNTTRSGVFTFFYGIPPIYWKNALYSNLKPALFSILESKGYEILAFASANLFNPEFNRTVFTRINNLRTTSDGTNAKERDNDAISDFLSYLDTQAQKQNSKNDTSPFLSFLFLDQLHASTLTKDDLTQKLPYPVVLTEPQYLNLNNTTDPTASFDLYRNTAFIVDQQVGKIVQELISRNIWDQSIVIFTSDHGQEFNDTKLNYWGHNSNFTRYQTQIPLIIHWPQKEAKIIDDRITTSYDISATILHDYFKCTNEISDYSIGESLFTPKTSQVQRTFISGSYLENAIISPNQIAVIKATSNIKYLTPDYRNLPKNSIDREVVINTLKLQNLYKITKNE